MDVRAPRVGITHHKAISPLQGLALWVGLSQGCALGFRISARWAFPELRMVERGAVYWAPAKAGGYGEMGLLEGRLVEQGDPCTGARTSTSAPLQGRPRA